MTVAEMRAKTKAIFQAELRKLDQQLADLEERRGPDYQKHVDQLKAECQHEMDTCDKYHEYLLKANKQRFTSLKRNARVRAETARKELQARLKEAMDKEKAAEIERYEAMKISTDLEQSNTRQTRTKLRRRAERGGVATDEQKSKPEIPTWKTAKSGPVLLLELDEAEAEADLAALIGTKVPGGKRKLQQQQQQHKEHDRQNGGGGGKSDQVQAFYDYNNESIHFEGKTFYRGSKVTVEWLADGIQRKFSGILTTFNLRMFMVRHAVSGDKICMDLAELVKGRAALRTSQGK